MTTFPALLALVLLLGAPSAPQPSDCQLGRSCTLRDNLSQPLNFTQQNCYCDDLCHMFDDCCHDKHPSPTVPGTLPETSRCKYRTDLVDHKNVNLGYLYIISNCPESFDQNSTIRELCEGDSRDIFLNLPVTGTTLGLLYKNVYCAACTGLESADVRYWGVKNSCSDELALANNNTNITELFSDSNVRCSRRFVPPDPAVGALPTYRRCWRKYVRTCPAAWPDPAVAELCHNHTDIVHVQLDDMMTGHYKNAYCAKCHGHGNHSCLLDEEGADSITSPVSYSILLDMNTFEVVERSGDRGNNRLAGNWRNCTDGAVYDPFRGECRPSPFPPKHADCERFLLAADKFTILANSSVYVEDLGRLLDPEDEYEIRENQLIMCRPPTVNSTEVMVNSTQVEDGNWEGIVTVVCVSISLVFLVPCIIAHIVYKPLRNVSGRCVLGISASLFVGQLLFLTATQVTNRAACTFLASLMQFGFLSSFSWSNCLAFDMSLAFSRTIVGHGNSTKKYIRYSVYAWVVPLVFVLIAVSLDQPQGVPDDFRPAYGDPVCWINGRYARLVTFVLPLAAMLLTNIILFGITVHGIVVTKRSAKAVLKTTTKSRILDSVLYFKLSLVMGLTWIFGFLAMASDSTALWYIFDIFNGLQGFGLFLVSVLTRQVTRLTKDRATSFKSTSFYRSFKRSKSVTLTSSDVSASTSSPDDKKSAQTDTLLSSSTRM